MKTARREKRKDGIFQLVTTRCMMACGVLSGTRKLLSHPLSPTSTTTRDTNKLHRCYNSVYTMNTALEYRANIFAQSVPTFEEGKFYLFTAFHKVFGVILKQQLELMKKGKNDCRQEVAKSSSTRFKSRREKYAKTFFSLLLRLTFVTALINPTRDRTLTARYARSLSFLLESAYWLKMAANDVAPMSSCL